MRALHLNKFAICLLVLSIFLSLFAVIGFNSTASDDRTIVYRSVCINKGDTINSIANNFHKESGFNNTDDFIFEINRINHLSDNIIHEGAYLVIPFYI